MLYFWLPLIALFASAFSTVVGFGGGIIFIGFATCFIDVKEVIPISTIYFLALSCSQLWVFRKRVDRATVKLYCLAALPGIAAGMVLFYIIPSQLTKQAVAVLALAYCANALFKLVPETKPSVPVTLGTSFVAGLVDAVTAAGGTIQAPLFLSRGLRKETFVASFAATSVLLNPLKIGIYYAMGFVHFDRLLLILPVVLAGILGVQVGKQGLRFVTPERFRHAAVGFLAIVAMRMLIW